jgi:hypothetical protein
MRSLSLLVPLALSGVAVAQALPADFKIYPGVATQFDQTCTSFTSRCALGAAGGEYLQEVPMGGRDTLGNTNDFFRGVGQNGTASACEITNIYYITQDQNCVDQETYSVRTRRLAAGGAGPATGAGGILFDSGALLTPPGGPPSPCAWGINLALPTPSTVPCGVGAPANLGSWFVGTTIAANSAWTANGQSTQGSWYVSNTIGDVPRVGAGKIAWEIKADGTTVAQCGTDRILDIGVSTALPTMVSANIHGDPRCPIDPAPGAGGIWPSNSSRGDGIVAVVHDDASVPGAHVAIAFMSFSFSPIAFPLPGILLGGILIGPAPFIQIHFGAALVNGRAVLNFPFMAPGRLRGMAGRLDCQGLTSRPSLPFPMTNAVCLSLSATN